MTESEILLESQVREIYGRVIYTHKTHEKCAELLKKRSDRISLAEIALSAITTTTLLFVLWGDGKIGQLIAAVSSTILLALTLYTKDNNPLEVVEKHKRAAQEILEIREKLLSLLIDIRIGSKELEHFQQIRDELNEKLMNAYRCAPKTTSNAYQSASKALKKNEEFTFSDSEIDLFLPENLRRAKQQ